MSQVKSSVAVNEKSSRENKKVKYLNKDREYKEEQLKKYGALFAPLNYLWRKKLKKLDEELKKYNQQATALSGSGNKDLVNTNLNKSSFNNYLIGTDENLRPIYVRNLNQHMAVFGASGSGKSVFLYNLLTQTLEKGGGTVFIDGKGDINNMFQDFIKFAKQYDRLDDVYVLNFNKGEKSNSFNPFASLELNELKSIIGGFTFESGNQDFFATQAKGVMDSAFLVLGYLKKIKGEVKPSDLSDSLMLDSFLVQLIPASDENSNLPNKELIKINKLEKVEKFWVPKLEIDEDGKNISQEMVKYVEGYGGKVILDEDSDEDPLVHNKPEQLVTQHGYSQTQLNKIISLIKQYDNILNAPVNDIDFGAIIRENKIVYVIIPSMTMPAETANTIGAFLLEAIKAAIAISLGSKVEQDKDEEDTIFNENRLRAEPMFLLVLDELAAYVEYCKDALGLILAQARSVNVATILSSQDIPSLSKGQDGMNFVNKILGNTYTKVFLKTEDPDTRANAKNIMFASSYKVDAKDKENKEEKRIDKDEEEQFLTEAKDGFGIIKSESYTRFLTPFVQPKLNEIVSFKLNN